MQSSVRGSVSVVALPGES